MCEGKAAAVNMTKEWMVILVKLRVTLCRHASVPHNYVHAMRNADFHLPSRQRTFVDAQTVVKVIRNAGCVRTAHLAFSCQSIQNFVLRVSAQTLLKID